jgi:hypothetical protein
MRRILRRRIDDPEPEGGTTFQWSNEDLDEVLNLAAAEIQAEIKIVDPQAFIRVTRSDIEADTPLAPKPQNAGPILDVKALSDEGEYVSMGAPIRFDQTSAVGSSDSMRYAIVGRWIYLAPTPTEAVENGLEWWFSETAQIATGESNDSSTFPIDVNLHDALIMRAQLMLIGEGSDEAKTLRELYTMAITKIPTHYRRTLQPETGFGPDFTKTGQLY